MAVGSKVPVWQDINLCTGLELSDSVHVGGCFFDQPRLATGVR